MINQSNETHKNDIVMLYLLKRHLFIIIPRKICHLNFLLYPAKQIDTNKVQRVPAYTRNTILSRSLKNLESLIFFCLQAEWKKNDRIEVI